MHLKPLTSILRFNLLLLLMPQLFCNTASAEQKFYTVGVVPQLESHHFKSIWRPILKLISDISGVRLKLRSSPGIPTFEKQFEAGRFDFFYMNPYHALVANEKQGYLPLLYDSGGNLSGINIVRNDSLLKAVEELHGKIVAFPAPNALGVALLSRAEFKNKYNIKVKEL